MKWDFKEVQSFLVIGFVSTLIVPATFLFTEATAANLVSGEQGAAVSTITDQKKMPGLVCKSGLFFLIFFSSFLIQQRTALEISVYYKSPSDEITK